MREEDIKEEREREVMCIGGGENPSINSNTTVHDIQNRKESCCRVTVEH